MSNANLNNAQKNNNDEFYTQLKDIEAELRYYPNHFKGKTVFCNCDDPFESNFTLYFLMHFNKLGLKRLISTGYATSPIAGKLIQQIGTYCLDITNTKKFLKEGQKDLSQLDALRMIQLENKFIKILTGDEKHLAGDFRSPESIELLKQSDVVVGNPPFSLFGEFFSLLEQYNKKYLFIGDINQVSLKNFFPYLKTGRTWMGATMNGTGSHWFEVPDHYQNDNVKIIDGKRMMTNGRACWWTNLDYEERHTLFRLGYKYEGHEKDYPKYDNFDAINIGYVTSKGTRRAEFERTPYDYDGLMGIPITAFGKICPEQFEIIDISGELANPVYINGKKKSGRFYLDNERLYDKIVVRNRQPGRNDWENWQKEIDDARKENRK